MLSTMRNDFKKYSWTLWLVIFAFIGGFIVTDAFRGDSRETMDLVFIGDKVIKVEEYQSQLLTTLRAYKEQFKDNFDKRFISQLNLPDQILQGVITSNIIKLEAENLHLTSTDEELREKILKHPQLQKDGKFIGYENYRLALAHARMNVEDFEKSLREQIVVEKFKDFITGGMVVDTDTLKNDFFREKDNAEIEYVMMQPDMIKEAQPVSDSEIAEYYEKNKQDFKSREQRAGQAIILNYADFKKDVKIEPAKIFEYFKTNKSEFAEEAKAKVSRILLKYTEANREEIQKKADALQKELSKENFALKAQEMSEDEKGKEGGDHGFFGWQGFTQQEKSIIESMAKDEISSPVDAREGFSILMVMEKTDKRQKAFDEVKDLIRDTMERQELEKLAQEKIADIHKKVKDSGNLKESAAKLDLKVVETGMVSMGQPVKDVDPNGFVSRNLFQLKEKEVSAPISLQNGVGLAQLTAIQPSVVEPLDKVKDRVKLEAEKIKKLDKLMETAAATTAELNALKDDKEVETYLKGKDLTSTPTTYQRGDRIAYMPEKAGLDEQIFAMNLNTYSEPIRLKTAIAIVKVKSKKINTDADFIKEKEAFYTQKLEQKKNEYFSGYLASKRDEYEVRINRELYDEVREDVLNRFN